MVLNQLIEVLTKVENLILDIKFTFCKLTSINDVETG